MRSPIRHVTLAAVVVLAACGDDSVSPSTLTEAEAEELAGAIFSQSLGQALTIQPVPAQTSEGPSAVTFSETVDVTAPCPMGGQVSISGSIEGETDDQTGAGQIDFDMSVVHASCVVQGEQGTQFTLTGDPSLGFAFTMTTDGEQNASFSGSISGGIDWATEDKEGTCSIGFDLSGESSPTGFSFQTAGTICGADVSRTVTVSG